MRLHSSRHRTQVSPVRQSECRRILRSDFQAGSPMESRSAASQDPALHVRRAVHATGMTPAGYRGSPRPRYITPEDSCSSSLLLPSFASAQVVQRRTLVDGNMISLIALDHVLRLLL